MPETDPSISTPATVTLSFLLTDIEGSTVYWSREGGAFSSVLALHHAILREQIERHGGRELSEAGDGFLVAFETPRAAADCAIALQQVLGATAWPGNIDALRVRMALHLGPVEVLARGDFRGVTLNRAARLRDGAHGGQIICSAAFAETIAEGTELREIGLFRLRGLPEPERVFQLDWPGMEARAFPSLRLPPAFTNNLPPSFTRFFGREAEIARLRTSILDHRAQPATGVGRMGQLVTLTGPGGVGKTRLALAVAESLLDAFSHAIWFVPLADEPDAERLPVAVRDVLQVTPDAGQEPLSQVINLLASQPALVVFDNFEQLGDAGAHLLQTLRTRLPLLHCIATSRRRIGVPGEREFAVSPLQVPGSGVTAPDELQSCASVQLFVDRTRAARFGFELKDTNAPAVAELCRKLEGVPLALELAAARADVITPHEMVRQLDLRLDAFSDADPRIPARHRSLRAAVEWSYDFLPPELQEFFANLSVFRGGWTADAATVVAAPEAFGGLSMQVLRGLSELRSGSLISATEDGESMRFRMLETLRAYGEEKLETGGRTAAVRERHASHFLRLAQEADRKQRSQEEGEWLRRLDAEAENLRAALANSDELRPQLAAALPHYWMLRGLVAEGRDWLRRVLNMDATLAPALRAEVHNAAGILALMANDGAGARDHFLQASDYFRKIADIRNMAGLLNNLGTAAYQQGDYAGAKAFLGDALELYAQCGLKAQRAQALGNMGAALVELDQWEAARRALDECLGVQVGLGDDTGAAMTLETLAELAFREERFTDAHALAERSLALCARLKLRPIFAMNTALIAALAVKEAQWTIAATALALVEKLTGEYGLCLSSFLAARSAADFAIVQEHLSPMDLHECRKRGFAQAECWSLEANRV